MKAIRAVALIAFVTMTSTVRSQTKSLPPAAEATAALIEASKIVSLASEATLRVAADRAVVKVSVTTEGKTLSEGLEKNRKLREALVQTLGKQGIPADRIRSARFSSTPQTGMFSSKVKSNRVDNQVKITIENDTEFQAVAAEVDSHPEMTYQGLEPVDSKEAEHKAAALAQACENINGKKAAVEQAFHIRLAPARLGGVETGVPPPFTQLGPLVGQGGTAPSLSPDATLRINARAYEQRGDEGLGFGEKSYRAIVSAEFQIVR